MTRYAAIRGGVKSGEGQVADSHSVFVDDEHGADRQADLSYVDDIEGRSVEKRWEMAREVLIEQERIMR